MILFATALVGAQPAVAPPAAPPAPSVAAAPAPVDPARLALGREIVAVVLPPEQRMAMMTNVLNAMMGNMMAGVIKGAGLEADLNDNAELRDVFMRFVERQRVLALADIEGALPELVEAYARFYARTFSLEDLREIRSFVATPAGARFMQRSPQLLSDPDVATWQRKVTAQGAARQKGEMERFKAELMAIRKVPPEKS